ncbi:MAG TPA: beta-ketoacyl synthase N-terminal-like domain-containing protein [Solimonas sp.]|nr:beta-ketoacyl synthase N-terminal-like domain-containing protein [Solimonas sp.]
MRRPVYLAGGEADSAAGTGLAASVAACLAEAPLPQIERFDTQLGELALPFFPFAETQEPVARVQRVAESALQRAGLDRDARGRMGLFVGSSSGLLHSQEQDYLRELAAGATPLVLRHPYMGDTAEQLAVLLGIGGPRQTITTACSAGANAILYAAWMIREGLIDEALVVGTEFRNQLSLLGFHSLLLVSRDRCRPFDLERTGVVLGETAAALVLSAHRPQRGWEVVGGGTLCDVSHPTSPAPQKIAQTLQQALDDAQLAAADILAVKAHGTGTGSNDLAEGLGIRHVFAQPPPVTSIKPVFGHTLGACGVLETLALTGCLEQGWMPATGGLSQPDPEIGLAPLAQPLRLPRGPVLLNYFGFGGNNCSLVLRPC